MTKALGLAVVVPILMLPSQLFAATPEPLVDRVRDAIDRGVRYLREKQLPDGSWEVDVACTGNPGGWSSLAMLALLNAGVLPEDPVMVKGLNYLRSVKPAKTYVVGLQTMVYALAAQPQDIERIQKNADWLLKQRVYVDGQFRGWTYGAPPVQRTIPTLNMRFWACTKRILLMPTSMTPSGRRCATSTRGLNTPMADGDMSQPMVQY
jgi:hypothetical protein